MSTEGKDPDSPAYRVGYRRPPKQNQFKSGHSGNPRGRPKGIRSLGAVLQEIIQQKIPVTENGKTRRLPALEVILRRIRNDAMRGEAKAIHVLFSLVARYAQFSETTMKLRDLLDEDQRILAEYLEHGNEAPETGNGSDVG